MDLWRFGPSCPRIVHFAVLYQVTAVSDTTSDPLTFISALISKSDKKHKYCNAGRSNQIDTNFRHNRRTVSNLPTTDQSDGNRAIFTYSKQEQDSRLLWTTWLEY